jgi:hypothetical protein
VRIAPIAIEKIVDMMKRAAIGKPQSASGSGAAEKSPM